MIIHPVLLKEFDNFWYLLGYSESHKDLRTFGFDRIYEPMLLKKLFIATPQDIVSSYYKDIYAGQLVGYSNIENKHINYNERFLRQ